MATKLYFLRKKFDKLVLLSFFIVIKKTICQSPFPKICVLHKFADVILENMRIVKCKKMCYYIVTKDKTHNKMQSGDKKPK